MAQHLARSSSATESAKLGLPDAGRLWAAIAAAGPLHAAPTFDPDLVDDVVAAERSTAQYDRRRAFVASFSWAVPTPEAIERIRGAVGERRLLEVCAGTGLWARLLADAGVRVVATDEAPYSTDSHYPVECLDAEAAVKRHGGCSALLLCWPPFRDGCAARALRAFEGDRVICTGDARFTAEAGFHDALDRSWHLIDRVPLPSWPGTADQVRIFIRK